jgi:hypothetical protein
MEIAEKLASSGDTKSANRLAVLACTLARWTNAAQFVLSLDKGAPTALLRVLQSE